MAEDKDKKVSGGVGITIGTFDGLHRGHQLVIDTLKRECALRGLRPVVICFDRHPLEVVAPERAPKMLMHYDERDEELRRTGVDVVRIPFTQEVRCLTAAEWVRRLSDEYNARLLVIGYDNRFGSDGRNMSDADFIAVGKDAGLDTIMAPRLEGCSSSAVRNAVSNGDISLANRLLGRNYKISGSVVSGRRIGRTIGVPTANIHVNERAQLPPSGVYAAIAGTDEGDFPAVVNVGDNPTVANDGITRVEAHLIGFSGNLYGKVLSVRLLDYIRGEKKFESLSALKEQIAKDIEKACEIHKKFYYL